MSEIVKRKTNEELAEIVRHALENSEPCWCGTPDEGSCPACGSAIAAQVAFGELMRRMGVET